MRVIGVSSQPHMIMKVSSDNNAIDIKGIDRSEYLWQKEL
jgi:hypothetical protein